MNRSTKCKTCKKYLGESFRDFPEGIVDDGTNYYCNDGCYKKNKCYHNNGWCSVKQETVFLDRKGNLHIGFNNKTKHGRPIICQCNSRCGAKRRLYFSDDGKFLKFGKLIKEGVA